MADTDEMKALKEAIATGARRIRFKDGTVEKDVEYASFADLRARYNFLLEEQAKSGRPRPRVGLATFGRG